MPPVSVSHEGLSLRTSQQEGGVFMSIGGEIDRHNVAHLRSHLVAAIGRGCDPLVVDLTHLMFLSSAGLVALVEAARLQRASGGRLLLRALRPEWRQLLNMAGFADVFEPVGTGPSPR